MYSVIARPPSVGAVQLRMAEPPAAVAITPVEADGRVTAVIWFDADDATLGPMVLVATTVNVYLVPSVSPDTVVASVEPPTVVVSPPGLDVAVYPVMPLPPLEAGADHTTAAERLPAVAVTLRGDPGTVAGVTALEAADDGPEPLALLARAVKV